MEPAELLSLSLSLLAGFPLYYCCRNARRQPSEMRRGNRVSWAAVDQALGRAGKTQPDGVQPYSFPRPDLSVQFDGV